MPRVTLKLNQKLIIIPDWQFGKEGWWVGTSKPKLLTLDPEIDFSKPPQTGWIWTPHEIGSTKILIQAPPSCVQCENSIIQGTHVHVKIVDVP